MTDVEQLPRVQHFGLSSVHDNAFDRSAGTQARPEVHVWCEAEL